MAFALGGTFSPPSAVVPAVSGGRTSIPIRTSIIPVLSKSFSAVLSSSPATAPCASRKWRAPVSPESLEYEAALEPEAEPEPVEVQIATSEASLVPKGEEVFAVVMIGSRQYIVFPGRYLYTQRLKGANANDKIILNKVLLVGTKTKAYIGEPIVTNAAVHAVVEEQGLNNKVVVFKYKRKKNYRRNIGHRQPNTRIRITGISGYQDFPADTMLSVPA